MFCGKSENRSPKRSVLTFSGSDAGLQVNRDELIIFQILHGQGMSSQIDFGTGNG